jgi:hypothetical protein
MQMIIHACELAHDRRASGKTEMAVIRAPSTSPKVSREAPMIAEHLHSQVLEQDDGQTPDHRLRNRMIIGNMIAWIAIIIAIRLIFF